MKHPPSARLASIIVLVAIAAAPALAPAQGGWTTVDKVIAVVNQEVVLQSDLDRRLAAFKQSLDAIKNPGERAKKRIELSKQVVQALINQRILFQEATRMGLAATDQEVEGAISQIKAQNKLDDAGLARELEKQGLTMPQYRVEMRGQIMQAKVSNLILRPRIQISEEELRAAYDEAKKRDPQRIGKFDEVKGPLAERVFEAKMNREQQRWLIERREHAYIDVRTKQ
jgi:peptidyl-prolyl cis-trans isomerase SurA